MNQQVGVYDDPHAPVLLTRDTEPFEGETVVEFVSARGIHFFDDRKAPQRSSRIVAWFRAVAFEGQELPRYYPVICECESPVLNTECKRWRPKGGRSNLYGDAAVALGRLPRNRERLVPSKLFRNKLFTAEVQTVRSDRLKKPLPRPRWHSRLGSLIRLEAGGESSTLTNSDSLPIALSGSDSAAYSDPVAIAAPVTETSPLPTSIARHS